jgi:Ca2+-binding EF-hand superfamily protein
MKTTNFLRQTGFPSRPPLTKETMPKNPPAWLKNDRMVLQFNGYFQEHVVENPDENYRVRKCTIYYYLDDDTMYITEPRIENSGIPQGVFLKRHRFPNSEGGFYHWTDLDAGKEIEIYGRVYRLTSYDKFTAEYFSNAGYNLSPIEGEPEDNFKTTRMMINMKQNPPDLAETKEYFEVKLKGGNPNKKLASYLENDRKVLSFTVLWDDTSYDGGEKKYILNYFLSDQTIEVKEIRVANSGIDDFPMFLKRMKVPKDPVLTHYPSMSMKKEEFYVPEDLVVGNVISIYGREVLLIACDPYTTQWFKDNYGIEQVPLKVKQPKKNLKYQPVPKYNGYGTEEDSMVSVNSLIPKAPKKNEQKIFKNDMHILRFDARLVSTEPDDENRKFIIAFYCGDDTIQVYEICDRNSGRVGGKFLEKKTYKNPFSNKYYIEKDFAIGKTIHLNTFRFQINDCDEYTHKYMEDNAEVFPQASIDQILEKIKGGAYSYSSLQEYVIHLMKKLDKNGDEVISFDEFRDGLKDMKIFLSEHEVNTLLRVFDHNGDGKISMEEFYNTLASSTAEE